MCSWPVSRTHPADAARSVRSSWCRQTGTIKLSGPLLWPKSRKTSTMANDPACFFIDASTPEGQATGVLQDSVVSCLLMATIKADNVDQVIGALSDAMKQQLNGCVKAALGVP